MFVPNWTWREPSLPLLTATRISIELDLILLGWEHTPYLVGQACKGEGGGVDCVRFVCSVLDELYGTDRVHEVKTLPNDASMHTREGAFRVMRTIRELYAPNQPVEDGSLEPGDVVVVGPSNGGPGHAMICGPRQNELWHSSVGGVHRTGIAFSGEQRIFRVFRCSNREAWIQC